MSDRPATGFQDRIKPPLPVVDGETSGQVINPANLSSILQGSPFLAGLAAHDGDFATRCLVENPETLLDQICQACREAAHSGDDVALGVALRQQRRKFALLAGLADVANVWSLQECCEAHTRFADVAVQCAVTALLRQAAEKGQVILDGGNCGYVVLAMGKHGAAELNYSSDIDLVVLFDFDIAEHCGIAEPQGFFVKITRRLVSLLQDLTEEGYVFRCDLRLRPDPRATQVAIALEAAATYYENLGQNWERAAYIKARAIAGDIALGQEFLQRLQPYIWRKYLDFAAIADVQSLIRQIHASKGHGEIAVEGHNIKLGRGGIREIEFFVQTQQLIAGGKNKALRGRQTLPMLQALAQAGWISETVARDLHDAYLFLRRVEHRIQMVNDQQTHVLPDKPETFESFARFCGYSGAEQFREAMRHRLETVSAHSSHLFESAENLGGSSGSLVFTGGEDDPATLATLSSMGYERASEVSAVIRGWHFGRYAATRDKRAREALTEIMPNLLAALAQNGNADHAFLEFDRFLHGLPAGVQLFAMLRAQPALLDLMALILATAPKLAEGLSRQPRILEAVLDPGFKRALPPLPELQEALRELAPDHLALEEVMDRARVFAREQKFRVGFRILSETVTAEAAGHAFAAIAGAVLERMLQAVKQDMARSHGTVPGAEVALVALGKLGGEEMTAGSDLDLILVYDQPDEQALSDGPRALSSAQYHTRMTQRLVTSLSAPTPEGLLYDVDMRLRPSGSKGPVAVTFQAFTAYHGGEAWTWEKMALTRARVVAGAPSLMQRIEEVIRNDLAAVRDVARLRGDATEMRRLMLKERKGDNPWDIKHARGGLIELEFIAQVLMLQHACQQPHVLDTNTFKALSKLAEHGFLLAGTVARLKAASQFYSRLTQILRLCLDGDFDPMTSSPGLNRALATAAGLPNLSLAEDQLREHQTYVAEQFNHLVGDPTGGGGERRNEAASPS